MKPMICQVCKSALNSRMDSEFTAITYLHPEGVGTDHEPIPVEPPHDWRGECDFCSTGRPEWVLPTRGFTLPDMEHAPDDHMSAGDWAACDECARLIERNQWSRLVERAVTAQISRHPDMEVIRDDLSTRLGRMYRLIRKNTNGTLRPLD